MCLIIYDTALWIKRGISTRYKLVNLTNVPILGGRVLRRRIVSRIASRDVAKNSNVFDSELLFTLFSVHDHLPLLAQHVLGMTIHDLKNMTVHSAG